MTLKWIEPLDDFNYTNISIYIYESKKYYNLCNFTEEEFNRNNIY